MSVNLATKYSDKLDERYKAGSFTDNYIGTLYNWEGVNAIKVWTVLASDLSDYSASGANRFSGGSAPSEVDDEAMTYTLTKKRSFAKTFDETNVQDQLFVKKANAYLKQMWDEKYIPEIDKHRLTTWANGAAFVTVNGTALTKSTVCAAIRGGMEALDNAMVPQENRAIFVTPAIASCLMMSDELKYNQAFTDKAIIKGKVTEYCGADVISVPTSRMPAGVEFIIKYKNASADPMKLRMLRANSDAPGIAGTLMEGLCRYDSFVLAQKAAGIYAYFQSGACAAVVLDPTDTSNTKLAMTCSTASSTIKYTDDGTNPKTSSTVKTYSAAIALSTLTGKLIRAYAEKSGLVNSGIEELQL